MHIGKLIVVLDTERSQSAKGISNESHSEILLHAVWSALLLQPCHHTPLLTCPRAECCFTTLVALCCSLQGPSTHINAPVPKSSQGHSGQVARTVSEESAVDKDVPPPQRVMCPCTCSTSHGKPPRVCSACTLQKLCSQAHTPQVVMSLAGRPKGRKSTACCNLPVILTVGVDVLHIVVVLTWHVDM